MRYPWRLPSVGIAILVSLTITTACVSTAETPQTQTRQQENGQSQPNTQWVEVGQLPLALESHQMVCLGNFVYVLGGWNDTRGPYSEVFYTPLTTERTLDNWQQTTVKMPLRLQHHGVIPHNNALYVLGGDTGFFEGSTVSDRILRAIPNAQGDITEWVDVGKLPKPLTIHAATTIGNQLYILGGSSTFRPGTTVLDTVFTATISPEGDIGNFQTLNPFPTPIGWLTATVVGNHIIALSGKVKFSPTALTPTVWRATADANSQLSPFAAIGKTVPRERHATVRVDKTLVVIAGGGKQRVLSRVDAVEIDPQGNLMEWRQLAPLPAARYAHAAFAYDGDIYVSGGFTRYGSNETSRKIFRLSLP